MRTAESGNRDDRSMGRGEGKAEMLKAEMGKLREERGGQRSEVRRQRPAAKRREKPRER
jgi:hypothetical protein